MMPAAANFPAQWDRAVAYGDGLFETVLVMAGVAPLWPFHRARLEDSLRRLSIQCDIGLLEISFFSLAKQQVDAVIKITVARSGGSRGYDCRAATDAVFRFQTYALPRYSADKLANGINIHVCRQRLSSNPALAGIKHLNRLEQVLAASEWCRAWADEGLLLDQTGAVIEGTISNIFIVMNRILLTPRLESCGVAGVMRAAILKRFAEELDLQVAESRITITDVLSADAVFMCNSVFGIWPVNSIGVSLVNRQHPYINRLWESLDSMGYSRLYG